MGWKEELKNYFGEHCSFNAPLNSYMTYSAGGAAEALVYPKTADEWRFLLSLGVEVRVLGLGSNILVSDKGLPGITASTKRMDGLEINDGVVTAGCGLMLDKLVLAAVEHGLGGLEKLSGIPGSVGGAVYMNAGAYGQETFDCLEYFEVLGRDGAARTIKKTDIKYAYRKVDAVKDLIILSAAFRPQAANGGELLSVRNEILARRKAAQPLDLPSAGSVFKRPEGDYASRLIDAAGLRGLSVGGAKVSEKHAGFIVNFNHASAADIYALMNEVRARVKEKFGVDLELEQILWGEF